MVPLVNGVDTGTIFYVDFVYGPGTLRATSTTVGNNINCGSWPEPLGFTSALRCKLQTVITSVGPLAGTGGKTVNAGSTITIAGKIFGSQCSGCRVTATPAGSTTSQQLTTTAWSNTDRKSVV